MNLRREDSQLPLARTERRAPFAHRSIMRESSPRFSKIVSVDPIRTFKPDPAVYEYLVAELHARREMVWLISSNPFDVIGAKACGLRTAWVQRDPKRVFDPWEFEPDVVVHGLAELPGKLNLVAQASACGFPLELGKRAPPWQPNGPPQAEACATQAILFAILAQRSLARLECRVAM